MANYSERNDDTVWKVEVEFIKNEKLETIRHEYYTDNELIDIIKDIEEAKYPGVNQIFIILDIK